MPWCSVSWAFLVLASGLASLHFPLYHFLPSPFLMDCDAIHQAYVSLALHGFALFWCALPDPSDPFSYNFHARDKIYRKVLGKGIRPIRAATYFLSKPMRRIAKPALMDCDAIHQPFVY